MALDYGSVLMAVGAAGTALCFTLVMNWLRQKTSGFLATWAIAMAFIVGSVIAFSLLDVGGGLLAGAMASVLLTTGFSINHGGMVQFREGEFPMRQVVVLAVPSGVAVALPFAFGFDGLGLMLVNIVSGALLTYTGIAFWRVRRESVVAIMTIAILHFVLAVSFALCAVVGAIEAPLYLGGMPQNWAEMLNLVCSVVAITGIGGLFVTIHQERITRRHRVASLTDPLTNLFNRRALFERYETGDVPLGTAIVIFDLDDFKAANDRHGHAFGDMVLRSFAQVLDGNLRFDDMAVRLGGEEFAAILPDTNEILALDVAERIREQMAQTPQVTGEDIVFCTVSAGVAFAGKGGKSLDTLMRKADNALYFSKRNGRNRVSAPTATAA